MTPEELATIEARANEAQPGPWWVVTVGKNHDDGPSHVIMSEHVSITEAFAGGEIPQATDAAFMAKSRTDVPDLIAEVRALTAERDDASAELARVTAERDELRAIVEGRKVAPTDAELTAHDANGARWLVKLDGGKNTAMVVEVMAWPSWREWLLARGASRWWPIDANGPCAWPKVTP